VANAIQKLALVVYILEILKGIATGVSDYIASTNPTTPKIKE